ncbi:MAG: LLM class flavin-dependent oxidoreductase [Dehalococcoidia bacterium]|nr:LLM class flavin-dependent oxidoreductase [Dehalococcoidia bacterium]MSQ17468.1 LLM class flavin-dependent oxidoreductase [Dehalococcoidia bacterium]
MAGQKLSLSVVDQSPVRQGCTAGEALWESVELAAAVEKLGYQRYWVAEHHNLPNFAGTSPEILIGQLAARTRRIRVGSGGVMLSHYSALKVAENFRVLSAMYPGRIDLGIGRAPGSDPLTAAALAYPGRAREVSQFPRQVTDLMAYLSGGPPEGHPFAGVRSGPGPDAGVPQIWLLGSRVESAYLAAQLGLPFSYAHFFGSGVEDGPDIVEGYRKHFQPSSGQALTSPLVNVTVHVLCAETEAEARRLAASRDLARLNSRLGRANGIPPVEEALAFPLSGGEKLYMQQQRRGCIDGDPQQVRQELQNIAQQYQTQDLGIVTICHGFRERVRSYELVAAACGIVGGS